jgi:chromosome partitioning protein
MITIAITNQKGGVGKTTIAFNLVQILARKNGAKILAIDNDPQGNLTSSWLENPDRMKGDILNAYDKKPLKPERLKHQINLLGANIKLASVAERDFQVIFHLKESLDKLQDDLGAGGYDYVVIDCLPSFGHLHLAALVTATFVLIPVKPAPYALAGLKDLFETIDRARRYFNPDLNILGIIINQVDGRKLVMEREMEQALREKYGNLVLKNKINKRIKVEESPAFRKPITEYNPKGPAAKEFKALVREILTRING